MVVITTYSSIRFTSVISVRSRVSQITITIATIQFIIVPTVTSVVIGIIITVAPPPACLCILHVVPSFVCEACQALSGAKTVQRHAYFV